MNRADEVKTMRSSKSETPDSNDVSLDFINDFMSDINSVEPTTNDILTKHTSNESDDNTTVLPKFDVKVENKKKPDAGSNEYLDEIKGQIMKVGVKKINTLSKKIPHKYQKDEIDKFNILQPENMKNIIDPIIDSEDGVISRVYTTTMTIIGRTSGINVDYKDMSPLVTNKYCIMLQSNFEEKVYEGYKPPVKPKQNRGRRQKAKPVTKRKKQGSGKHMHSQITVVIDYKGKKYKVKLFNGDSFQVPGINDTNFHNFLIVLKILESYLYFCYRLADHEKCKFEDYVDKNIIPNNKSAEANLEYLSNNDPSKLLGEYEKNDCCDEELKDKKINVMWLKANTKNYKMYFKLLPRHVLNLHLLFDIFQCEMLRYKYNFDDINEQLDHDVTLCNYDCTKCEELKHYKKMEEYIMPYSCYHKCGNPLKHVGWDDNTGLKIKLIFYNGVVDRKDKFTTVNIFRGATIDGRKYHQSLDHTTWGAKILVLGGLYEKKTRDIYDYLECIFTYYFSDVQVFTDDTNNLYELGIYKDNIYNEYLNEVNQGY